MASFIGIARPYARAAFDYAREQQAFESWKVFLDMAALVMRDQATLSLLKNPDFTVKHWSELLENILTPYLDTERRNFLRLIALHNRFTAIPEIAELFNTYLAQYEKESTVRIVTAVDLDATYKQKLTEALTKRLSRTVILREEIDPNIMGGAIIHIGDRVIDGSIRGKLTRLLEDLTG
ncbi:MAG: F0F1 ATP synthase subunit delta [Gammaproteobacteria bacterium]|nr:F0F1 ATP synthase subunit delta [Gammaproteobacteria bacterium]